MKDSWDDNDVWTQALILAYEQVCSYDDLEEKKALAGIGKTKAAPPSRGRGRRGKR